MVMTHLHLLNVYVVKKLLYLIYSELLLSFSFQQCPVSVLLHLKEILYFQKNMWGM